MLGILSIQEFRWSNVDDVGAVEFIFFGKSYKNSQRDVECFVNQRVVSAIMEVEFVFVSMSHIVLGVRWCDDGV
jgi:hypothetical protein